MNRSIPLVPLLVSTIVASRTSPSFAQEEPLAGEIESLVRDLGAADFDRREEAGQRLVRIGLPARPRLEAALADPDPEIARRARQILVTTDRVEGIEVALSRRLVQRGRWQVLVDIRAPGGAAPETLRRLEDARASLEFFDPADLVGEIYAPAGGYFRARLPAGWTADTTRAAPKLSGVIHGPAGGVLDPRDAAAARARFEKAIEFARRHPGDLAGETAIAMNAIGLEALSSNEFARASIDLATALEFDDQPVYRRNLAAVHDNHAADLAPRGHLADAKQKLKKALEIAPDFAEAKEALRQLGGR